MSHNELSHQSGMGWAVVSEFQVGRSFEAYVQFVRREQRKTAKGDPFYICVFGDKTGKVESMAWQNSDLFRWCQNWEPGDALWIAGTLAQKDMKYKPNLEIHEFERIEDNPAKFKDFEWSLLIDASKFAPEALREKILQMLHQNVGDHRLVELVELIIADHWAVLSSLPAASRMHHAMKTGWLEHIWSMTRLAITIGKHYATYYNELDPPLQTDILIVGATLHDIGKVLELSYDQRSEASYTTPGRLLGHIVMGRDMIRQAAGRLDQKLDEERLLRLEHAVLAHHGCLEFGSPVLPQTLEAFILSQIDDMDAKINSIARGLKQAQPADPESADPAKAQLWTDKITAFTPGRAFYRGTSLEPPPQKPAPQEELAVAESTEGG